MSQIVPDSSGANCNTKLVNSRAIQSNHCIHWFFTFNNYNEDDLIKIVSKFKEICKNYSFQEEIGKNGTKHLQGNIELKKKMRWTAFKLPKEIHWEPTRNVKAANAYCIKDETCNGRKWIWPEPEPDLECLKDNELYPWQLSVKDKCSEKVDPRVINWIYDPYGNNGKTEFARYMIIKHNTILCTGGSSKDIANLVKNIIDNGRKLLKLTIFIFDIPRCTEGHLSYKALEEVKNGIITNTKYEAGTFVFNKPHVWVFSNELPNKSKMSSDRWKNIYTINDKHELIEYNEIFECSNLSPKFMESDYNNKEDSIFVECDYKESYEMKNNGIIKIWD